MGIFGAKEDPRERLRNMVSVIRRQKYKIQRDITALQTQNKKVTMDIKKRAKAGNLDEAKIIAKELVNSRKAVSRLYAAGAHMDCLISELNCQAAANRMAGAIKDSTGVMKAMSALVKLPELNKTMQDLSKEMMKMGLINEMVDDTMESVTGDTELMDDEVTAEVNKIIAEVTTGQLPDAVKDTLPAGVPLPSSSHAEVEELPESEHDHSDIAEMQARLEALRN
ncbi:unnamed protein product [Calicophoron daubneyi]|uniref:Charged multivesicular body protein 3 n=1 Tax=Calicophoron daubneyi TaxID=300641 RepID=A0AAV2TMS4_CALDB